MPASSAAARHRSISGEGSGRCRHRIGGLEHRAARRVTAQAQVPERTTRRPPDRAAGTAQASRESGHGKAAVDGGAGNLATPVHSDNAVASRTPMQYAVHRLKKRRAIDGFPSSGLSTVARRLVEQFNCQCGSAARAKCLEGGRRKDAGCRLPVADWQSPLAEPRQGQL